MPETQLRHFYPDRYGGAGVKEAADAALARHYDQIDAHLEGCEWLVGAERSVADCFLFMLTRWGRKPQSARVGIARTCAHTGCGAWSRPARAPQRTSRACSFGLHTTCMRARRRACARADERCALAPRVIA